MILILRPHIEERNGCRFHLDRFDAYVMAADYLWLSCHAPHPDLVVVDESVIGKAAEIVSFDPSRIVEDQRWVGGEIAEAVDRRQVATLVHAAITQHREANWHSSATTGSPLPRSGPPPSTSRTSKRRCLDFTAR